MRQAPDQAVAVIGAQVIVDPAILLARIVPAAGRPEADFRIPDLQAAFIGEGHGDVVELARAMAEIAAVKSGLPLPPDIGVIVKDSPAGNCWPP